MATPKMNPFDVRCSRIPKKYYSQLFANILKQHGVAQATHIVHQDFGLMQAFDWTNSNEGFDFWCTVLEETKAGKNYNPSAPKTPIKNQCMLDIMVQDATQRGFAIHKWTTSGKIMECSPIDGEVYEHELLDNGDFFFHNIKVYKNGEWLTPLDDMPKEYEEVQIRKEKTVELLVSVLKDLERLDELKKKLEESGEQLAKRNPEAKHPFNRFDINMN